MSHDKTKDGIETQLFSGWKAQSANYSFERDGVPRTPHTELSPFAKQAQERRENNGPANNL